MNIEEQIQYLDAQIIFHEGEALKYKAVKDTISGLVAPEIESISGLIEENTVLKSDKRILEDKITDLEKDLITPK